MKQRQRHLQRQVLQSGEAQNDEWPSDLHLKSKPKGIIVGYTASGHCYPCRYSGQKPEGAAK